MPRNKIKETKLANGERESEDFLTRLRATSITRGDIDVAREQYGYELPDDVIEQIARQHAIARPILEQYHMMFEQTPTLTMAKASLQRDIDAVLDVFVGMDLNDLGDVGEFEDEYSCPKCAHRWSGSPNYRYRGQSAVYIPNGKVSRTGKASSNRVGAPSTRNRNFKYGRSWKGAGNAALPRGFGNRDIGEPVVSSWTWRKTNKPPASYMNV